ncbi:hypothetical protein AGLY_008206 [Aphis glycines]|uniref:Uncharacterized protein n=1 Tax=Aphis glycines TaxID=307491 RepID=A0A6G0TM17_APHGL|nr:hypothetical protein AGLY_008206 [Aphis glycines]
MATAYLHPQSGTFAPRGISYAPTYFAYNVPIVIHNIDYFYLVKVVHANSIVHGASEGGSAQIDGGNFDNIDKNFCQQSPVIDIPLSYVVCHLVHSERSEECIGFTMIGHFSIFERILEIKAKRIKLNKKDPLVRSESFFIERNHIAFKSNTYNKIILSCPKTEGTMDKHPPPTYFIFLLLFYLYILDKKKKKFLHILILYRIKKKVKTLNFKNLISIIFIKNGQDDQKLLDYNRPGKMVGTTSTLLLCRAGFASATDRQKNYIYYRQNFLHFYLFLSQNLSYFMKLYFSKTSEHIINQANTKFNKINKN